MKTLALLAAFAALAVVACSAPMQSGTGTLASVNKGEDTLSLISLASGETMAMLKTGFHPQEVAFSPDGKIAIVSNMGRGAQQPSKTLTVVDVAGKKVTGEIDLGEHGAPHGVEFVDAKRILVTSHATDSLLLIDIESKKIEKALASGGKGTHLAIVSPDKKRAYAINVFTADLSVIDLAKFEVIKKIACETRAEGVSVSPDGKWVAVGNVGANTVTIIDAQKLEVVKTLKDTRVPIRTFFTSDSKRMLVSCAETGELAVFGVGDWAEQKRIKLAERTDLKLKGGAVPVPMNFARHPSKPEIFVVIINADAVVRIVESTLAIDKVFLTGGLPDGIAVTTFVGKPQPA